ncbi:uncharacterized protein LOC132286912 isoform X2 [Cornus florida]|uniref:uncharacterized protein LOC132286912 isoform X2 n=1 Tax=Cornus florida TaxID=4283 RepID=UPI00289C2BAD|nr:uncharacterized protein LOC132286912 isoform X2 [Cornus florida]
MGEEDDPQNLKKIAAAAYDYDKDPRWADYWSNVLIPPQLASRSGVIDHFKRKFYQRYIDPDLVVEPMSSSSSSPPARSSAPPSSSTTDDQTRLRNSGSTTRTSGTSTSPAPNPTSLHWDQQTIQFSINAWKPRAWNMQAVQVWFHSVISTKDFIYLIYCLTFVTSHFCLKFALITILCRTLEHVAKFLRRNFSRSSLYTKYLEEPCVWVESNTTTLSILSSQAEIGLGLLLIISLFTWQRNIIQTFMYWQLLKLMFHGPATAGYHRSVWAKIGRTINPLLHRYVPFLNTPISAIQRWWLR